VSSVDSERDRIPVSSVCFLLFDSKNCGLADSPNKLQLLLLIPRDYLQLLEDKVGSLLTLLNNFFETLKIP
jgi:hypothetical protein